MQQTFLYNSFQNALFSESFGLFPFPEQIPAKNTVSNCRAKGQIIEPYTNLKEELDSTTFWNIHNDKEESSIVL